MEYITLKSGRQWPMNTAYMGDCLDFMRELPDKCIDLVLTDPPYFEDPESGKYWHGSKQCVKKTYKKIEDWKIPTKEILNEIFRVSKHQIIWGCNYFNHDKIQGGRIVWDKGNHNSNLSSCEIAFISHYRRVDYYYQLWSGMVREAERFPRIHPTQKPVRLFKWCLEKYAPENALVFDPFLGSFTTAVACHHYGLNWIGCEKDPDYFRDGMERYVNETQQIFMEFE